MDMVTEASLAGELEGKGRVASLGGSLDCPRRGVGTLINVVGMFIIDQFQTTDEDGEPQISQEESVRPLSSCCQVSGLHGLG